MHTIEIPEAKIKRYIPSDLSECDEKQYMAMCELIYKYQQGFLQYEEFRIHAICKLMNIKRSKKSNKKEENDADEKYANLYFISKLIDDFFEETEDHQKVIKQYYIHNPVPHFKPLLTTFYGPTDSFMNMTFGEYTDGLRLFLDFHATKDVKLLYDLTAIFYRPQKTFHFVKKQLDDYDGDIRQKYNPNSIEKRAKTLQYAPIGFIYGFYLLFASFQKYLTDAKIMWAGKEIDLAILFNTKTDESSTDLPGIGMDSIAFAMAESGTFGTLEKVRTNPFWEIIIRMYDLRIANLEREKQEKNDSN